VSVPEVLVSRITEEIIKRLAAGRPPKAEGCCPAAAPIPAPDLIVAGSPGALSSLPAPIAEAVRAAFSVHEVSAFDGEGPSGAPLLLPILPVQSLVRVAEGDEGCTVEGRQLLKALCEGRPAVVWEGGIVWRQFEKTAPRALVSLWRRREDDLRAYGVKLVPQEGILAALSCSAPGKPGALAPSNTPIPAWSGAGQRLPGYTDAPHGATRVLTEALVMTMHPPGSGPGRLVLEPDDVLTPLARDYLAAQKITVG
jgi:hypothetical protein